MYFGPPKTLAPRPLRLAERELGDRPADAALDPLGAEGDLVVALTLAPFLRAVRVPDRHAHDGDRRVDAADRNDAGDATARSHDHLAADLLAEDPIRRPDVVPTLGRDRRGLEPETVSGDRPRRLVHDAVRGLAPARERQVEARQRELDAEDVRLQHADGCLEELLSRLVALEHDDRARVHRAAV